MPITIATDYGSQITLMYLSPVIRTRHSGFSDIQRFIGTTPPESEHSIALRVPPVSSTSPRMEESVKPIWQIIQTVSEKAR